ncbi:fumarylacetoacetate hydrolase family protein [Acidocella sp.]|uniref:fumarylacetoacetate hydrolase family protein n=1 Tax=Acidocella sp. TaxID=50710 RepID=UPI003D016C07
MQLIAYRDEAGCQIGVAAGADGLRHLAGLEAFFADPPAALAAGAHGPVLALAGLTRIPAVPASARILCIGLNYRRHAKETGQPIPDHPVVFGRWVASLAVDGDDVPAIEAAFDWEGELAVSLARPLFRADPTEARDAILGYAAFNDLSARSFQRLSAQWTLGKNSDRSGPLGAITTVDEAGDPALGWRLCTRVNGEIMQDSTTADMIFDVPNLLSRLSQVITLHPGDIVATGTPSGVGLGFSPPRFLKPGDEVDVQIGALAPVRNRIAALTP